MYTLGIDIGGTKCAVVIGDEAGNILAKTKIATTTVNETLEHINGNMEKYEFALVGNELYGFIWDDFCSWYIELSKSTLNSEDASIKLAAQSTLYTVLKAIIKMLHPFMPFVTEEIWQDLAPRAEGESIMVSPMPKAEQTDEALLARFALLQEAVSAIRNVRKQKNLPQKEAVELKVVVDENYPKEFEAVLVKMGNLSAVNAVTEKNATDAGFIVKTTQYFIPMGDNVNVEEEIAKLEKDLAYHEGFLASVMKKLSNERFVSNAPEAVVAAERKKQADAESKIAAIKESLAKLQ